MKPHEARDEAVDRLLRRSVDIGGSAETFPECLDAETVAAWTEGALDTHQLRAVEAHVSLCARCQSLAAVMIRTTADPPTVVPWWRRSVRSTWLVPVTAGAAAVILWAVVPEPASPPLDQRQVAEPSAPITSPPAPQPPATGSPTPESPALADRFEAAPAAAPRPTLNQRADAARNERKAIDDEARQDKSLDLARRAAPATPAAESDRLAAVSPSPRPPPPLPSTAPVAAAPPPATASASPAQPSAQEPARFREAAAGAAGARLMKQEIGTREIASPDPAIRWRVGAGGSIERTVDGGQTWTRQPSGVTVDLASGVAPSISIGWIVGRNSTVLRTIDGRTWVPVNVPEVADLIGVQAGDASIAVVFAADGRRFRTLDGGQTWTRQPPQDFESASF